MAIVQISRITNRKGLTENLPQLAGAELGWCTDSRRLFIGNGTLQDGAPVIGNTEILTEFSDITVLSDYTYEDIAVGYAAQTGPTPSDPVVRTVQAKLDDFADVRDFGAVGNGVADDTAAINRALYQLYCREANSQVRRTLYFPAGTYLITETIIIPTWAKLVGEGADCTIIQLAESVDISSLTAYVARFGDSLQQTGANIGNNGATTPRNIEISSMTFRSAVTTDVFYVEAAAQCWFDSVNFVGPLTISSIITDLSTDNIAGVRFNSTSSAVTNQITFDKCRFTGLTYGINTDQQIQGVTVSNSKFDTLYQGIVLGDGIVVDGGATGFRAVHNIFDDVYAEGILYDAVSLNASAYNAFYNVANNIGSSSPTGPVIRFGTDNNVSVNDMFERSDAQAVTFPRVSISNNASATGGTLMQLGRYSRANGRTTSVAANQTNAVIITVNSADVKAFRLDYTLTTGEMIRTGSMTVATKQPSGADATLAWTDDYTVNTIDAGVSLSAAQNGANVTVNCTTGSISSAAIITYSLAHLA